MTHTCPSCANQFTGKYCNACGEKVLEEKDFTLMNILEQAVGTITNIDSKLFRTLIALFTKPALLSVEFVRGARKRYMKPFQLFILANVFFFIFLSEIDIFRTPSKWFFIEHYDSYPVLEQVRTIMAERTITQAEVALLYDAKSSNLAKGLIFLLLPVIALIAMLLHWRQRLAFGKHVIFGIHFFTFVLIFAVLWTEFIDILVREFNNKLYVIPIQIANTIYLILSFRRFYRDRWWVAIWKGILGILFVGIAIQAYRMSISIWTINHI